MNDVESAIRTAILGVAPEADLDALAPDDDLQLELDLDSMDFLNVLIALEALTGVAIPEADYRDVRTMRSLSDYVASRG